MRAVGDEQVRWGVVVPVKHLDVAKSRLAVLGDEARRALALAFARDVVAAAVACRAVGRVLVVTDDPQAVRALAGTGAHVVADDPAAGLNAALAHGAAALTGVAGLAGVAAVSADLPCFTPDDLDDVLRRATRRSVVPDAAGAGTTLLVAPRGAPLAPSFGPGSLGRHVAGGAVVLDAAPGARRDVDTPDDLRAAERLGVGPATAAALTAHALVTCAPPDRGTMPP